jgi:S-adenosylmethionine:diacylglycerol 3-amino-3-carboxypropyl transferase
MIYYSHVNEDNNVERNALLNRPAKSLYAIAGSGERVIALMDCPTLDTVHFIDNNWDALYLSELKIAALGHLDVKNYCSFIGFSPTSEDRWVQFMDLKPMLSEGCRRFWALHRASIEMGVCNCGHFEQFLQRVNPIIRCFLGKGFYQCFSVKKADWKRFPMLRWRFVKAIFSCRWTYLLLGMKDSAFISKNAALESIPLGLQKSLDTDTVPQSGLFHLVFNGNLHQMLEENLPPSFQTAVLQRIKTALADGRLKVHYHFGDVLDVLTGINIEREASPFFSLSDILSFVNLDYQQKLINLITSANRGKGILIFRAFVRNRLTQKQAADLKNKFATLQDLTTEERSHFYQVFQIDF